MKFFQFTGAGDQIIGPAYAPTITVVCTLGSGTLGFFDDTGTFFPFEDGVLAAGEDGVFLVGYQTNLGFQTLADATIGIAGRV